MKKEISITELLTRTQSILTTGNILIGEYEPGNGINYKAIAIRWPSEENFNALGSIYVPGWLVVNCNTQLSYLFQSKKVLVDDYIQEKLGGLNSDYPYFGDLVRKLIGRPNR